MTQEITKKQSVIHFNDKVDLTFVSDVYKGNELDTEVYIADNYICTIAGNTKLSFMVDLNKVIEKHKI